MNKVKVNDFVNAYAKAVNLSEDIRTTLLELMENIIRKYEKIVPNIPVTLDDSNVYVIKPVNGKYSVEDFFLNRLMRNVWEVSNITEWDIQNGFANEHTKGQFDVNMQSLNINQVNLLAQMEKYRNYLGEDYDKMSKTAIKKVIMHEFEHALQTKYNNDLDLYRKGVYAKIIGEIEKLQKYSNNIKKHDDFSKEIVRTMDYMFCSTRISSSYPNENKKTYRDVNGNDNLYEILNESESLEMSGQVSYLNRTFKDGNQFPYRNPESSNAEITNYGDLFKIVFGKRASFNLMYLDPLKGFEDFNKKFNEIFQNEYQSDKDAIEIFITAITNIKKTNSEEEHLKLNTTLARCLEKRIKNANEKVSSEKLNESLNEFRKYCVKNNDKQKNMNLEHIKVLDGLKELLSKRDEKSQEEIIEVFDVDLPLTKDNQQAELDKARQDYEELSHPTLTKSTQKELEEVRKIYEDDSVKIDSTSSFTQSDKLEPGITKAQVEEQKRKEGQEKYRKEQHLKQQQQLEELKQLQEAMSIYEDDTYDLTWYMNNGNENSQRHGMKH